MKKIAAALLFAALWSVSALAQIPQFPQTLPPNTVLGRTGIIAGPAQAIPFATLSALGVGTIANGGSCPGTLNIYQPFANSSGAPTGTTLNIFDGSQCVPWATLNQTTHVITIANSNLANMAADTVKCNPTGSAGAVQDCTNPAVAGISINPVINTSLALNSQAIGPASGTQASTFDHNQIFCSNENYTVTGGAGIRGNCLEVFYGFGGVNTSNPRSAITVTANLQSQPTTTNPFYSAFQSIGLAGATAGGTGTTSVTALGAMEGIITFAQLGATSTNYASVVGIESTVQILSGGSSLARHGISLVSQGDSNAASNGGVQEDDAIHIGSGGSGAAKWINGIYLSHFNSLAPLATTGCVICSDNQSDTVVSAIDLHTWTFSGNTLSFANFLVRGSDGRPTVFPATGTAGFILNNVDTTNNAEVFFQANGASKWEMGKDGSGNFFLFDDVGALNAIAIVANANMSLTPKNGHIAVSGGSNPTNNACTGFALSTGAKDTAGRVTFTSATSCAINFGTAYTNAPFCTVTPGSAASTVEVTTSTTVLTATFGTAQTAMFWQCFGA